MQISSTDGYRLWASCYDTAPNPLIALEGRLVPGLLGHTVPKRVLDIACGTGRWGEYWARRGASVIGVDACEEMLTIAAARSPVNFRLAAGRAEELPFAGSFADLTICSLAASYIANLPCAVAEMARVTRDGGTVLVSDMHPSAVAAGWTRSFTRHGAHFGIPSSGYALQDLYRAASTAGLHLIQQAEATFGEPERPIFERAAKAHLLETLTQLPAIWVGIWERRCC